MFLAFIIEHAANIAKIPQKRKFPRIFPFSFQFIFVFKIVCKVLLDDVLDGLLHLGRHTYEPPAGYLDARAFLHQRHVLPKLGFGAQLHGALVVPALAVLLSAERAGRLEIHSPEKAFHLLCHLNLAAVVVDRGVGQGGEKRDAAVIAAAPDALAKNPITPNQYGTARARGAFPPCPRLAEEALSLEVLVKLVGHLHTDVAEDAAYQSL